MEVFFKTVEEYKEWKKKIKNVLDENFDKIAELIMDTHGENILIPIRETIDNNFTLNLQISNNSILNSAVVINRVQPSNKNIIWFYKNSCFYLIERGDSHVLNIAPTYQCQQRHQFVYHALCYRARFEDEIEFVIELLEWSDSLIGILKSRMNKINPKEAMNRINKLVSTAQ